MHLQQSAWSLLTLDNLFSGFIGAFILLVLQELVKIIEKVKRKKRLLAVLLHDIFAIYIFLFSDESKESELGKELVATRSWRDLTPLIIDLIPANIVQKIAYVYLSLELKDGMNDEPNFKKAVRINIDKIFTYAEKQSRSMRKLVTNLKELMEEADQDSEEV